MHQINDESIDRWVQSLGRDYHIKKRKKKRSATLQEQNKVIGEQPEIVPANQLNLFL